MVKEVKQATSNSMQFTKHLAGMLVAISLLGLGVFAAWQGHYKMKMIAYAVALIFSGAVNLVVGSVVLYRVLMHKEA